jgi:hypothetical protein
MNPEPKKQKPCEDEDEVTVARSILDEIIEETESEDWDKEKPQDESAAKFREMSLKS